MKRMEKIDFIEYVKKKVKIVVKSGWKYQGKILELTDTVLVLDDIKDGKIKFNFYDISSIQELR